MEDCDWLAYSDSELDNDYSSLSANAIKNNLTSEEAKLKLSMLIEQNTLQRGSFDSSLLSREAINIEELKKVAKEIKVNKKLKKILQIKEKLLVPQSVDEKRAELSIMNTTQVKYTPSSSIVNL